jgi:hypothetical protein
MNAVDSLPIASFEGACPKQNGAALVSGRKTRVKRVVLVSHAPYKEFS